MSSVSQRPDARTIRKVIVASTIGSTIEWYDFILFSTASALVFNVLFFPDYDPLVGTILALATNAVAFIVRPLGGVIFGSLGDRYGRKFVLAFTLVMMGIATTIIGALPTYEQVGLWAPILLLILRIVQGLGAGAEFGGAIIMVAEYAPANRRALFTSIPGAGVALGLILGSGFLSLLTVWLSDEAFLAWGWRIPFLVSAVGVAVGLYIRLHISESPEFKALEEKAAKKRKGGIKEASPLKEVFRDHRKNVLTAILACFAENGTSYLAKTFILTYIAQFLLLDREIGLNAVLLASIVSLLTFPLYGALADKIGVRKVYLFGAVFVTAFAFPFFGMMNTMDPWMIILAVVLLYAIGVRGMSATQGAYLSGLFPAKVRYTGVAMSREIASALSGGLAPIIGTALLAWTGQWWPVALYIMGLGLITIVAVAFGPTDKDAQKNHVPTSAVPVQDHPVASSSSSGAVSAP